MKLMYPTLVAAMGLLVALPVRAEGEDEAFPEEKNGEEMSEDEAFLEDKEQQEIAAPEKEKNQDLHEDDDEQIYSVGVRLRWIMIPEWFIAMFGVDTKQDPKYRRALPLISNIGVGPEFIYRKGGFDITAAIWYVGLSWDPILMKGDGETEESWEVVENDMKGFIFNADFIWSTDIFDWFAITYGAGIGFGVRWGDVTETEAMLGEGLEYEKCPGPTGVPGSGCVEPLEEGEYGKTYDKFHAFPWIEFLLGVRFKPHRHVAIYVDGGFSMGFQVGGRVGYIF
jgi:hypothetical protein